MLTCIELRLFSTKERATGISSSAVAAPTSGAVIGVLLLILLLAVLLIVFVRYRVATFSLSQTLIVCVSITQGGGEVTEDQ